MISHFKFLLYGGIYSQTYEELSDGGPKCYNDISPDFRLKVAIFSIILNLIIIFKLQPYISKMKESHRNIN